MRRTKKTFKKRTIVVVGFSMTLLLVFTFIIGFRVSVLISEEYIDPNSSEFILGRNKAQSDIVNSSEIIKNSLPYEYYGKSTADQCQKGIESYKGGDPYDFLCVYKETMFYGFDGDIKQELVGFRDIMRANKWQSSGDLVFPQADSIDRLLINYYDKYDYSSDACHLPFSMVDYSRNDLSLSLDVSEKSCSISSIAYFEDISNHINIFHEIKNLHSEAGLSALRDRHKYMLGVSIERRYLEVLAY